MCDHEKEQVCSTTYEEECKQTYHGEKCNQVPKENCDYQYVSKQMLNYLMVRCTYMVGLIYIIQVGKFLVSWLLFGWMVLDNFDVSAG